MPLAGCSEAKAWSAVNVTGTSPALQFTMQRAPDGKAVTAADYRGQIVMLYFGYTFCPDVCPLTLQNVNLVLDKMGPEAKAVRMLFVTVDPGRDTLPVLGEYTALFGPQFTGLSGTPDQLARLARRYRIAYSVTPLADGRDIEVMHSAGLYVFDRSGAARLLLPSLASSTPDIDGLAADLTRLVREKPSAWSWVERLV